MKKKTVCVVGLGYIGLPTAVLLANNGFSVIGYDTNNKIVKNLNKKILHIVEPNVDRLLKTAISKGRLKVSNKVVKCDVYIICVPTPANKKNNIYVPNIDYVITATKSIAPFIKKGDLIILESTCPVGSTKKIEDLLIKEGVNLKDVYIAYCPERVLPGNIIKELIENDRIVGGLSLRSSKKVSSFYSLFVKGKIIQTDAKSAELCKLTENSFRDVNIAFANELSMICENLGIDVFNLIKIANKHPRVNILQPGVGVGGHCIAIDPWFIVSEDFKNSKLIRKAREVNEFKTKWVIKKIKTYADEFTIKKGIKPKIACLGLTFKPDIDDLRESKALKVAETLFDDGYKVTAVEPNISSHNKLDLISFTDAIEDSDIICILVKHKNFIFTKNKKKLSPIKIFDFCNAFTQ